MELNKILNEILNELDTEAQLQDNERYMAWLENQLDEIEIYDEQTAIRRQALAQHLEDAYAIESNLLDRCSTRHRLVWEAK